MRPAQVTLCASNLNLNLFFASKMLSAEWWVPVRVEAGGSVLRLRYLPLPYPVKTRAPVSIRCICPLAFFVLVKPCIAAASAIAQIRPFWELRLPTFESLVTVTRPLVSGVVMVASATAVSLLLSSFYIGAINVHSSFSTRSNFVLAALLTYYFRWRWRRCTAFIIARWSDYFHVQKVLSS